MSTKKKPKRLRIDSTVGAVKVMQGASKSLTIPSTIPLSDSDKAFFANILAENANSDWTPHQLELAALLARTMSDLNDEQLNMRDEGSVLKAANGAVVISPRKTLIQLHSATIVALRRSIGIHSRAMGGEARDVARRSEIAKGIESDNPLDDDLLARPN